MVWRLGTRCLGLCFFPPCLGPQFPCLDMRLWCLPVRHGHGVTGYECLLQGPHVVVGAQPTEPVLPQPRADHLLLLPPGDAIWGTLPAPVKSIIPGRRGGRGGRVGTGSLGQVIKPKAWLQQVGKGFRRPQGCLAGPPQALGPRAGCEPALSHPLCPQPQIPAHFPAALPRGGPPLLGPYQVFAIAAQEAECSSRAQ